MHHACRLSCLAALALTSPSPAALASAASNAPWIVPDVSAECAATRPFDLHAQDTAPVSCDRRGVVPGRATNLDTLDPVHRAMVENATALGRQSAVAFATCFAPGTSQEVIDAFRFQDWQQGFLAFQNGTRWPGTAYTPGGSPQGKPLTISYSIVPDGTPIAGFNGEAAGNSNLRARLNTIYGSQAVWLPIIQGVFARWSQVTGITYVYEANDDGVDLATDIGLPGVRGDCRIGGHTIDGNSGVLAYNFYPDEGDMVIDTGDNFFDDTANGSLKLRNVLQHEHGHGLGMPHVCPIEQTKLMEPFVSTAFDGIRHDDMRHGQYLYGDDYEPNDSAAQASNLGTLDSCTALHIGDVPAPDVSFGAASLISIENNGEIDWFKVAVSSARRLGVVATPIGFQYDNSAQSCSGQSGSCCSGNITDTRAGANLTLEVLSTDGATVLASASGGAAGVAKAVSNVLLPAAGTYYIRVSASVFTQTQMYKLDVTPAAAALGMALSGTPNIAVNAGTGPTIDVTIASGTETLNAASAALFYKLNGGSPVQVPLTLVSGSTYRATLPQVLCSDTLEFRAQATGSGGTVVSLPCSGSFYAPATGVVTTAFSDTFETDQGWTTGPNTGTAAGLWTRVDPNGTAAQPEDDHTADPGVTCWVTGQAARGTAPGTGDLDNGQAILNSPTINLAGQDDATVSYWRWFSNGFGAGPYNDTFRVQVSTNGGTNWTTAETIGPGSLADPEVNGNWRFHAFTLSSVGLVPTANVKIRFIADDTNPQSLLEAGVDDVVVTARVCAFTPPPACALDYNLDGNLNPDDLGDFITDYYTSPHIPGPGGYATPCPENAPPYDNGYKANYTMDGSPQCNPPFPDNLGDYITSYYQGC